MTRNVTSSDLEDVWADLFGPTHPTPTPRKDPHGRYRVYRVYERATHTLVYVGCTNDVKRRISEHRFHRGYRPESYRYEWGDPLPYVAAIREERRLIREHQPRDNVRHAS